MSHLDEHLGLLLISHYTSALEDRLQSVQHGRVLGDCDRPELLGPRIRENVLLLLKAAQRGPTHTPGRRAHALAASCCANIQRPSIGSCPLDLTMSSTVSPLSDCEWISSSAGI